MQNKQPTMILEALVHLVIDWQSDWSQLLTTCFAASIALALRVYRSGTRGYQKFYSIIELQPIQ